MGGQDATRDARRGWALQWPRYPSAHSRSAQRRRQGSKDDAHDRAPRRCKPPPRQPHPSASPHTRCPLAPLLGAPPWLPAAKRRRGCHKQELVGRVLQAATPGVPKDSAGPWRVWQNARTPEIAGSCDAAGLLSVRPFTLLPLLRSSLLWARRWAQATSGHVRSLSTLSKFHGHSWQAPNSVARAARPGGSLTCPNAEGAGASCCCSWSFPQALHSCCTG